MKSCIEWRKSFKYFDEVDEYNIEYKRDKIDKLIKFLDKYSIEKGKRVNIEVGTNEGDVDVLIEMKKKYDYNIALKMKPLEKKDKILEKLRKNSIPFYFNIYVTRWNQLNEYISCGVSDVIISGELGFDLPRVAAAVGEGIQVRAYVNVSQYIYSSEDTFKSFFIRPEDMDFYSQYIDVAEFYNSDNTQNTLYEIYFKDKKWDGKLREIIKRLDDDVNNYYILGKEFAIQRSKCKKNCIKGERCRLCDVVKELAYTLEKSKEYDVFKRR